MAGRGWEKVPRFPGGLYCRPGSCVSSGVHVGDHPWEAGALGGLKERRMLWESCAHRSPRAPDSSCVSLFIRESE